MRLLLLLFMLNVMVCQSQSSNSKRLTNDYSALNTNLSGAWISSNSANNIEGSVYLYDKWETNNAIILTKDGQKLSIKGLNYDTMIDAFVAKVATDSVYVFNNNDIKEVRINENRFKRYFAEEINRLVYFQVLAVGKDMEFLKTNTKKIKNGMLNPLTQVSTPDKYVNDSKIFLKRGNKITEIKLKKKAFSRLFDKNSKAISSFISNENLSLNDERNLQKILNYYNTL